MWPPDGLAWQNQFRPKNLMQAYLCKRKAQTSCTTEQVSTKGSGNMILNTGQYYKQFRNSAFPQYWSLLNQFLNCGLEKSCRTEIADLQNWASAIPQLFVLNTFWKNKFIFNYSFLALFLDHFFVVSHC